MATGSEKSQRDLRIHPGYEREYGLASALAAEWPFDKLARTLQSVMRNYRHSEDAWGAIDAFADLIIRDAPPSWPG